MTQLHLIPPPPREAFAEGALLLRGYALDLAPTLLDDVTRLGAISPPRQMSTPGGLQMSASLTNCGALGWTSDASGYRYSPIDPMTGAPWPPIPAHWLDLAQRAASEAGYTCFEPDVCLVNRYPPGSRLGMHQDKDERSHDHPVVSVSLGITATFVFGGVRRRDAVQSLPLHHGDVAVWGGPSRLAYHGVRPIATGHHPMVGPWRWCLTFRKAG
ncbi:MAG: DNA oxidative demethylase AlkB [Bradymonadia bacterium]